MQKRENLNAKFVVMVKDAYCGQRGYYEELCETDNLQEAQHWFKQWKKEYSKDNGYTVKKQVF